MIQNNSKTVVPPAIRFWQINAQSQCDDDIPATTAAIGLKYAVVQNVLF
jgi:hypothetical protein